jgi:hypothetical protein
MSINYHDLYWLSDPMADQPLRLADRRQYWVTNERRLSLFSGEWQPPEPLILDAVMGGKIADFLWSTTLLSICISQRVLEILEQNHFTGWSTYPVKVYGRDEQLLSGYHGFAVNSWAGERDFSRSQIVDKPPRVPEGKPYRVYRGFYFDEKKWDGSDIFRVSLAYIIVSKHVQEAIIRAKITNVRFMPLPDVERTAGIID